MLNLISSLPVCFFVVATDAPNPRAIFVHEMAHCWGWEHAEHVGTRSTQSYRAFMPKGKWLKPYPRIEVQFERMKDIPKICGKNEQFGCQWGGVRK